MDPINGITLNLNEYPNISSSANSSPHEENLTDSRKAVSIGIFNRAVNENNTPSLTPPLVPILPLGDPLKNKSQREEPVLPEDSNKLTLFLNFLHKKKQNQPRPNSAENLTENTITERAKEQDSIEDLPSARIHISRSKSDTIISASSASESSQLENSSNSVKKSDSPPSEPTSLHREKKSSFTEFLSNSNKILKTGLEAKKIELKCFSRVDEEMSSFDKQFKTVFNDAKKYCAPEIVQEFLTIGNFFNNDDEKINARVAILLKEIREKNILVASLFERLTFVKNTIQNFTNLHGSTENLEKIIFLSNTLIYSDENLLTKRTFNEFIEKLNDEKTKQWLPVLFHNKIWKKEIDDLKTWCDEKNSKNSLYKIYIDIISTILKFKNLPNVRAFKCLDSKLCSALNLKHPISHIDRNAIIRAHNPSGIPLQTLYINGKKFPIPFREYLRNPLLRNQLQKIIRDLIPADSPLQTIQLNKDDHLIIPFKDLARHYLTEERYSEELQNMISKKIPEKISLKTVHINGIELPIQLNERVFEVSGNFVESSQKSYFFHLISALAEAGLAPSTSEKDILKAVEQLIADKESIDSHKSLLLGESILQFTTPSAIAHLILWVKNFMKPLKMDSIFLPFIVKYYAESSAQIHIQDKNNFSMTKKINYCISEKPLSPKGNGEKDNLDHATKIFDFDLIWTLSMDSHKDPIHKFKVEFNSELNANAPLELIWEVIASLATHDERLST